MSKGKDENKEQITGMWNIIPVTDFYNHQCDL